MAEKEELNAPAGDDLDRSGSCCTPGSGRTDCCGSGSGGSKCIRTVIFFVVILLACVVAGRSLLTRGNKTASMTPPALSDSRVADNEAVLVLLTDETGDATQETLQQMEQAAGKITAKGTPAAAFRIDSKSDDYALLTKRLSVGSFPSVVVLVKGHGSSVVSGQITEARLLEAFLEANTPASCCPANSPACCPR
jgi:hypothetical protein